MKFITSILTIGALTATMAIAADEKAATEPAKAAEAPAATQPEGAKKHATPEEQFKKLDTNNDGAVSLEEFKASGHAKKDPAKAEEMFKKMDTDGNGSLSLEEFKAGHKPKEKKNK